MMYLLFTATNVTRYKVIILKNSYSKKCLNSKDLLALD